MASVSLLCTASLVLASGGKPDGRWFHSLTAFADGTAVLFGGIDGSRFNDICTLEVSSTRVTWMELSISGDVPNGRQSHCVARRLRWFGHLHYGRVQQWPFPYPGPPFLVASTWHARRPNPLLHFPTQTCWRAVVKAPRYPAVVRRNGHFFPCACHFCLAWVWFSRVSEVVHDPSLLVS